MKITCILRSEKMKMKTFLLVVSIVINGQVEHRTISEHRSLFSCHVEKAQHSTNTAIKFECIKKDN